MGTQGQFKRVGTHHGRFHADDVMATAILRQIFEIELIRTRDEEILKELDIVYDVGGGEFDHHGIDKVYRENGIPYAACGLIWRRFGIEAVREMYPELKPEEIESIFEYVDWTLIQGIDALDNGLEIVKEDIPLLNISSIIEGYNPQWYSDKPENTAFWSAVDLAGEVLKNTIDKRIAVLKSREKVIDAYNRRTLPEIIFLDTYCPWNDTLREIDEGEEVLFVIYPSKGNYEMQTVRGRDNRDKKPLPKSWAGKRNRELAEVTGVEDAVFCHTGRFIAVAGSLEGIMRLALLAVNEPVDW